MKKKEFKKRSSFAYRFISFDFAVMIFLDENFSILDALRERKRKKSKEKEEK